MLRGIVHYGLHFLAPYFLAFLWGRSRQFKAYLILLVPVASPTRVVSRSHLLISTAGWSVLGRDLGSHNGTVLLRPGIAPVLLGSAVPSPLLVGDVLDIGDDVTIRLDPHT